MKRLLQGNLDVLSDTLDITSELLARFGNVMADYHSQLKAAILPHLEEPRPVIRKRAIQSIGKPPVMCALCARTLFEDYSQDESDAHISTWVFTTGHVAISAMHCH